MKYISLLIFLFYCQFIQSQQLEWAHAIESKAWGDSESFSIKVDKNGNFYILGYITSESNFNILNKTNYVNGKKNYKNVFVSKWNAQKELQWVNTYEPNLFLNTANGYYDWIMDVDSSLNLVFGGTFVDSVKLNKDSLTIKSIGKEDIIIIKLDSNGSKLWHKQIGGKGRDQLFKNMRIDTKNDIVFAGLFSDTLNLEVLNDINKIQKIAYKNTDLFVLKMDNSGNIKWFNQYKGGYSSSGSDFRLTLDHNKDIIFVGQAFDTLYISNNSFFYQKPNSYSEIFVVKLNPFGDYLWSKSLANSHFQDRINDVDIDSLNNIYLSGYFSKNVDLNPDIKVSTNYTAINNDLFLFKWSKNGDYIWSKQFKCGRSNNFYSKLIVKDKIFLSNEFADSMLFDNKGKPFSIKSDNMRTIGVSLHSLEGEFISAFKLRDINPTHTNNSAYIKSLDVDLNKNIYIAGNFNNKIDFNPTSVEAILNCKSNYYSFFAKYNNSILNLDSIDRGQGNADITSVIPNQPISFYPNPFKDNLTVLLNDYHKSVEFVLTDYSGKKVYNSKVYNSNLIELEPNIPSGHYILTIMTDNHISHHKIIKE